MKTKTPEQYAKEAIARDAADMKSLEKFIKTLKKPDGFVGEWALDDIHGRPHYRLRRKDDIDFLFYPGGDGTTNFRVGDGWRTFDRRGIDASFYWKPWTKGQTVDIDAVFTEQFTRIGERRRKAETAVKIPGMGYEAQPETIAEYKRLLLAGKSVTFTPSGMGQGKILTSRRPAHRFGTSRARAETEEFFGVKPLYVETFDHD